MVYSYQIKSLPEQCQQDCFWRNRKLPVREVMHVSKKAGEKNHNEHIQKDNKDQDCSSVKILVWISLIQDVTNKEESHAMIQLPWSEV